MTTAWAHLPNAVHIDRIIASVKANSADWYTAWNSITRDNAYHISRIAARNAAHAAILETDLLPVWDLATLAIARMEIQSWTAARDAILALIVYDDCAYMLDSDPGELAIIVAFGDQKAILLLPACIAFKRISVDSKA